MKERELTDRTERSGVITILRSGCESFVEEHLDGLVDAGMEVIEVSRTADKYANCLRRIVGKYHGRISIGAGTILTERQAEEALSAGASFLISPHFDPSLVRAIQGKEIPHIAGCLTPSEVVQAKQANVDAIKIFPASLGGPEYIKALLAPLPGTRLVPTGGVSLENAPHYWKARAWAVGIGSEINSATLENGWSAERLATLFQRSQHHE
jgi:2-dehydro-3-deoxyphosphogluconate aldolase/(4S)-4-hydroxy-2-oxoglutarate aldolase